MSVGFWQYSPMQEAKWKAFLKANERRELEDAKRALDASSEVFKRVQSRLKSRCESRMRDAKENGNE